MMAGNPNWWSMMMNGGMHPQASQFAYAGNPNFSSPNSVPSHDHDHHPPSQQDFPVIRSWSQLLLGDERFGGNLFQQQKKSENWEDQIPILNLNPSAFLPRVDHVKQEFAAHQSTHPQFYDNNSSEFHPLSRIPSTNSSNSWPHPQNHHPISSCAAATNTPLSNSFLSFSGSKAALPPPQVGRKHHHTQEHSSEGNSTSSGGVQPKKPRVQQSSAQPALKVRKEKLGDRITALHQLVSPFGKTDTASVLSEAIGYIRFLEAQIEALSSPYMRNASGNNNSNSVHHQHHQQHSDSSEGPGVKDLRSRGLCLVPISCTQNVPGADGGGADFWAPAAAYGGASAF